MNKIVYLCALGLALTGCAPPDPTLAAGVKRKGGGLYSVSEMGFVDPATQAVRQCEMDGNKKLSIVTSTTTKGIYSGADYAVLLFRCTK